MKYQRFEDLIAWQKAELLVLNIYKSFIGCKDYSFRDQLCRAAVSITNNIAEGFEKGTEKDFIKFLYIAKGSCGEVRSMLYLAVELDYLSRVKFNDFYENTTEISKILGGFIKSLQLR